jgi:hypothetical protein
MRQELTEPRLLVVRLVDEYRDRCLWFLREDFYPETVEQCLRVLDYIQRHGDRAAYLKADQARRWLLQESHTGAIRGALPRIVEGRQ